MTKEDKILLLETPAFRRWLFSLIQTSGILEATANGSDGRNLYLEGRRSLGLDLLRDLDAAQPVQSPSGLPVLTLIQTLRESVQATPAKETPVANRPYADLDD